MLAVDWRPRRQDQRQAGEARVELADALDAGLAGLPLVLPPRAPADGQHSWHLYVVRLTDDAKVSRDVFIERLFALGIGVSVHYIPLHLQPYWRDRYSLTPQQFPHSQRAFERMVSLPLYTRMTDADAARVCDAVRAALAA